MATKRSVILRGEPEYNEKGIAQGVIKPGYLVKGYSYLAAQTADGAAAIPKVFACEREEMGAGFDDTYLTTGSGTISAYYASGDVVKVAACHAGMQVTAYLASGESVAEDAVLTSAGDGTLEAIGVYSSGTGPDFPIARALETVDAAQLIAGTGGARAIRVEVM